MDAVSERAAGGGARDQRAAALRLAASTEDKSRTPEGWRQSAPPEDLERVPDAEASRWVYSGLAARAAQTKAPRRPLHAGWRRHIAGSTRAGAAVAAAEQQSSSNSRSNSSSARRSRSWSLGARRDGPGSGGRQTLGTLTRHASEWIMLDVAQSRIAPHARFAALVSVRGPLSQPLPALSAGTQRLEAKRCRCWLTPVMSAPAASTAPAEARQGAPRAACWRAPQGTTGRRRRSRDPGRRQCGVAGKRTQERARRIRSRCPSVTALGPRQRRCSRGTAMPLAMLVRWLTGSAAAGRWTTVDNGAGGQPAASARYSPSSS